MVNCERRSGTDRRANDADWEWIGRRCNKVNYPDDRRTAHVQYVDAYERRFNVEPRRRVFSRRVRVGGGDRRVNSTPELHSERLAEKSGE
jgi:hypothetical protein